VEALTVAPRHGGPNEGEACTTFMTRKEPENRIPVKHQARGFMVGPTGFIMNERIH
jgi:hypothetical protein